MRVFLWWILLFFINGMLAFPFMDANREHADTIFNWYLGITIFGPIVWFRWIHPYSPAALLVFEAYKAGSLKPRFDLANDDSYYFQLKEGIIFEFGVKDVDGRTTYFILSMSMMHNSYIAHASQGKRLEHPPRWDSDFKIITKLGDMEAAIVCFVFTVLTWKLRKDLKKYQKDLLFSKVTTNRQ